MLVFKIPPSARTVPLVSPKTAMSFVVEDPGPETLPPPAGVAHDPSPRQKVDEDALVPEFRFVTGRFPVTPEVKGRPVALVRTAAEGVPSAGVTNVGEFDRTTFPDPVSLRVDPHAEPPVT